MDPKDLELYILPIDNYTEQFNFDLGELVQARNKRAIGMYFMTCLLVKMNELNNPPGMLFAISESEVLIGSLDYPTHPDRADACRWYGRYIRENFESECLYLITPMASWQSSELDVAPKDSRSRKEMAITILKDLSGMYEAKSAEEHMEGITNIEDLVWMLHMHEGMPGEIVYDGNSSYQAHQTDPDRKCLIQSNLFGQVMVGMGHHFPGIQALMESKEQQVAFDKKMLEYEEKHGLEHEAPPWAEEDKASACATE